MSTPPRTPMARSAASCAAVRSVASSPRPRRTSLGSGRVGVPCRRFVDIAQAFLEPLEEPAQPVDRGRPEGFGDLATLDMNSSAAAEAIFGGRLLALPSR